ncbi:hypothetical protein NKR19_g8975 [Coniochaeta hoffmannii]|uniref:Uncharacterized protein n=1 Tax=Coniochaeta hoffmannii TaxID=91930 RepID=A0AA38R454_9PEZI|nr:hypothetical protein NKR19_g8975 [Coniochaeta hoffmannii]
MPSDNDMATSNLSDPKPTSSHVGREDKDTVDRCSRGSDSSVPSMVEDHGSDISIDDDQYYRTSGEQIWDTFWHSGCSEEEEERPAVSPSYHYPALVTPSLSLGNQQFLASHKRPTQTQSLGAIEAPSYAKYRSADYAPPRAERRRAVHQCKVSYSIFPPQESAGMTRQKTITARRRPSQLTLEAPKQRVTSQGDSPRHSLRSSASARNLRSGSASSAFSANSSFSTASDVSTASDHTAITTPAASPRVSWDCPRTPKPTHVSQCMDFTKAASKQSSIPNLRRAAAKQPSLPNLRALPTRYRPSQPRSATAEDFAAGEARNARVVAAIAAPEPYPRPLFAPPQPVVAPQHPARRAPLPPVSQRLPPPVSATRAIPPPLNLSRPLPPLPLSFSRPQTPLSAPPRPQRPEHAHNFGPALSPPRPAGPPRATSQPLPGHDDFQPPVVSVFEWDSEGEGSDSENAANPSATSFAKRIARGFAHIQAARNHTHSSSSSRRVVVTTPVACSGGMDELTRIRSGETVTRFRPERPSARQRALTVEDVRRVEEDVDRLKLVREQVARERCSNEVVAPPPPKGPKREKSAIFGRMLGWRTQ